MSIISPDFQQLAKLALRLSVSEQLRLVVCLSENLTAIVSEHESNKTRPGSGDSILHILQGPPHLTGEDVDELEYAIAAGRRPARTSGVFEDRDEA